jgi:uracil-DNA glycosylase
MKSTARRWYGASLRRAGIILWNAFPWHTYRQGEKNKNRKPTEEELAQSADVLRLFLALYPGRQVYAVGRTAEFALANVGVEAEYIRHPATGQAKVYSRNKRMK